MQKARVRVEKQAKSGDGEARKNLAVFDAVLETLEAGTPVRQLTLDEDGRARLKELHLLTAKPVLYVANVAEHDLPSGEDNPHVARVRAHAAAEGARVVVICAQIEAELAEMDEASRTEFLADLGLAEPGLHSLIREAYDLLDLITYFTAGVKEVRAWTIRRGYTAPKAAGVIHSDFEHGFIRAETIAYDDFIACGGEQKAKEAGKMRLEGKGYVVQDGDIMHFRFNV